MLIYTDSIYWVPAVFKVPFWVRKRQWIKHPPLFPLQKSVPLSSLHSHKKREIIHGNATNHFIGSYKLLKIIEESLWFRKAIWNFKQGSWGRPHWSDIQTNKEGKEIWKKNILGQENNRWKSPEGVACLGITEIARRSHGGAKWTKMRVVGNKFREAVGLCYWPLCEFWLLLWINWEASGE